MNNKGLVMATLTAVALVIAIAILASLGDKARVDPKEHYLGEKEVEFFSTYYLAEEQLFYLELSGKQALKNAKTTDEFKIQFRKYLESFNLLYEQNLQLTDFSFEFGEDLLVKSERELVLENDGFMYTFRPQFRLVGSALREKEAAVPLK